MRALLLAPHNDDETLFAFFHCLRYRPHVVICLRSARMGDPHYPGKMPISAEEREIETEAAMNIAGCDWTQWPILDSEHDPSDQLEAFMWGLRDPSGAEDWDLVIAPAHESNGNDQHNLIAALTDRVFSDVDQIRYLTYTKYGHRTRDGREVEYEPDWIALKLVALSCYRSQAIHPATRIHFIDGGLREYVL